ncbi:hypothetical protein [Streptomyces globisporus]
MKPGERSLPEVVIKEKQFSQIAVTVTNLLRETGHYRASMDAFRDRKVATAAIDRVRTVIASEIDAAVVHLENPEVGGVCVVTPEDQDGSKHAALTRAIILMNFTGTSDNPLVLDRLNSTPFSLYGASENIQKEMTATGLHNVSPRKILGYHNDGALGTGRPYIPQRVGLQNVLLNYKKPGKLYWLPFSLWEEGEDVLKKYQHETLRIGTTPITHRDRATGQIIVDRQEVIKAPAVWRGQGGLPTAFLNGEPLPSSANIFREIQHSLERNAMRWTSEQTTWRLNVIRNEWGVHARSIMSKPCAQGAAHSRIMCRMISSKGQVVPSTD